MTRFRTLIRLAAAPVLVGLLAACGARGAPRPPLRIVPATIAAPVATRLADRVYLEFEVPDSDSQGTTPGDMEHVEVYALTTQPTDLRPREIFSEDWLDVATLVAVLPVRVPDASPADALPALEDLLDDVQNRDAATGPVAVFEVAQGEQVTVVERLTPEKLVPVIVGDPEEEDDEDDESEPVPPMPLFSHPTREPPIRSYVAFAVSSRGRMGDASNLAEVPLVAPPLPPDPPSVTYTAGSISIVWEQPPTFRLPVQEEVVVPPTLESTPVLPGSEPSAYVVHEVVTSGDPDFRRPLRLADPLRLTSYIDNDVTFGTLRCYAVRVLDYVGPPPVPTDTAEEGLQVLGDASPATCVVLTDTFPPAAPTGLIAVADTDGISLIWDESTEADLAGYVVLRGTAADATLQPLTVEPVAGTAYQDIDVTAGGRYIYQVQAVDTAVPPNASPPSELVTEIAR